MLVSEGDFDVFVAAAFHNFLHGRTLLRIKGEASVSEVVEVERGKARCFACGFPGSVVGCLRGGAARMDRGFKDGGVKVLSGVLVEVGEDEWGEASGD